MKKIEEQLKILLEDKYIGYDELKNFISKSILNNEKYQKEFIRILPYILKNTNENNLSWLYNIHDYNSIQGFLDTFIQNMFIIDYSKYHFLFIKILNQLRTIPIQKSQALTLIQQMIHLGIQSHLDDVYNMISDIYPDLTPQVLTMLIQNKETCSKAVNLIIKNQGQYLSIINDNIEIILNNTDQITLFDLKKKVEVNQLAYNKIIDKINQNTKKNIKNLIKSLYLKVVITHGKYHDLSYIYEKKFDTILEIIYLIIKDICKNEHVNETDIETIGTGAYSGVLLIGEKVIKIGLKRETTHFPNNPYINAMILRRDFPVNDKESVFVEVSEKVDTNSEVTDEELYQLYKNLRHLHLVWLDVNKRNVGRLLKDNKIYWRKDLPITDEILGLDKYRGNILLKKGDIVVLDNDLIYDEKNTSIPKKFSTIYQEMFEMRYQDEEKNSPQYSGKLVLIKNKYCM